MIKTGFEHDETSLKDVQDAECDDMKYYRQKAGAAFGLATLSLAGAAILAASDASAQTVPSYANEFTQPYGSSSYSLMTPYDATTRDSAGNRVIVDGVMMYGDNIAQSLAQKALGVNNGTSYSGTGYAIGNQLNVSVSGSFNNVLVDSTQINNGNQTVIVNNGGSLSTATNVGSNETSSTLGADTSDVLNGGLNF